MAESMMSDIVFLTPWFPPKIKPVRKGVYQIGKPFCDEWYKYWDGKQWWDGSPVPLGAQLPRRKNVPSAIQECQWRGLATKPKAPRHG